MRLLRISLILLVGLLQFTSANEKRSIVPQVQVTKTSEGVIEGSGDSKRFPEGPDQESILTVHQGSGYPSDDEDDVVQGSGNVVEGSGAPPAPAWQPLPAITTTSTTTVTSIQVDTDHVVGEVHTLQTTQPEVRQEVFHVQLTTAPPILEPQPPPPPPQPPVQPSLPSTTTTKTTRRPAIPAAIPPEEENDEATPFHNMLKPGVFAAIVGGSIVGLLATVFIIVFIVYRMRKKDEGSYALDEPKARPYAGYAYTKASTKEFYA
ncbi:unnamed protein product, partial [Mesorhabditis belari]|uniref:Syndecan n=1 Tax=Mesorhabditis belari TaxID=2138241 RepID=A0AAF3J5T1_9BILA